IEQYDPFIAARVFRICSGSLVKKRELILLTPALPCCEIDSAGVAISAAVPKVGGIERKPPVAWMRWDARDTSLRPEVINNAIGPEVVSFAVPTLVVAQISQGLLQSGVAPYPRIAL
ncbi:MAG: hypothetical protein ACRD6W_14795, partial [Nitrososphaerales archaeon]